MNTVSKDGTFNLATSLLRQCEAMTRYAFGNGKSVPGDIVEMLQTFSTQQPSNGTTLDVKQLASVHDRLCQIVAPASPATIQLFEKAATGGPAKQLLGPVPLIRRMMALAGFFLVGILLISLSPDVTGKAADSDMFEASGWTLFLNEVFLLCAAGLGATFAALFQVNRYIVNCTYDPKYEACYWIKFVLGMIAGFMLSELIDIHSTAATSGDLTRPVLAMVGGFSATVVYRILTRLTETIESLFQGDTKEMIATQQQAIKTKLTQQMNQDRLKLAAGLIDLQKLVASGATDELKQKLDKAVSDLIPIELGGTGTAEPVGTSKIASPTVSLAAERATIVTASPKVVN
jgi:hypothetical protein